MRKPSGAAAQVEKGPDFDTEIAKFTPRQMEAIKHLDSGKIKYLLFGGCVGGGKSYFIRWWSLRRLIILSRHWGLKEPIGMIACEDYPALKDRQLAKINREFPAWIGRIYQDHKVHRLCFILHPNWGGGVIYFRNLDEPSKYMSTEFAFICVDELTKNEFQTFDDLRHRLRWSNPEIPDIECQFIGATNPGGVGHGWCRAFWMDKVFPNNWVDPKDYRPTFAYVPSKADDNPHLSKEYWEQLSTLPDHMRAAFRDGDWSVFLGQAFSDFRITSHVISPRPIPRNAHLYMTMDWGAGAPFAVQWWWVDGDGRIYLFGEWYGWTGTPNVGLHLSDSELAEGLIKHETDLAKRYNLPLISKTNRVSENKMYESTLIPSIQRLGGHDMFQKKYDKKGGGQGPGTSEVFSRYGIILGVGDATRHLKHRQFHERLRIDPQTKLPMMLIYDTCPQFIRTIPDLMVDKNNPEEVDKKGEAHCLDAACHICMARPLALPEDSKKLSQYDKRLNRLEQGNKGSYTEMATMEQDNELRRLESGRDSWEQDPESDDMGGDDGGMVPTV